MCRSIKLLRQPDSQPTAEEITAAALQYVRKISGYRMPSRTNQKAFDDAVLNIAESSRRLLDSLHNVDRLRLTGQTKR